MVKLIVRESRVVLFSSGKLKEHGSEGWLHIKGETKSKVNSSEFNLCTLSV